MKRNKRELAIELIYEGNNNGENLGHLMYCNKRQTTDRRIEEIKERRRANGERNSQIVKSNILETKQHDLQGILKLVKNPVNMCASK